MTKVLFVCTGNIFRSLSAEYAMKNILPLDSGIIVSSAGTIARKESVHPETLARLKHHGIDTSGHIQRKINRDILAEQDVVIAMNTDHQMYLQSVLNHKAYLFYEASHGEPRPFPDLCDIYQDWRARPDDSRNYIHRSVDAIVDTVPLILGRLPLLIKHE